MNALSACLLRVVRSESGQMTVEFVIAFPVMMIIAVIAINSVLFFSECASFDRLARQAICVYGSAPGYGETSGHVSARVQQELQGQFFHDWEKVQVSSLGRSPGHVTYTAQLELTPTLFGRSFSGHVFGVSLLPLKHQVSMTIDPYKPGAII